MHTYEFLRSPMRSLRVFGVGDLPPIGFGPRTCVPHFLEGPAARSAWLRPPRATLAAAPAGPWVAHRGPRLSRLRGQGIFGYDDEDYDGEFS